MNALDQVTLSYERGCILRNAIAGDEFTLPHLVSWLNQRHEDDRQACLDAIVDAIGENGRELIDTKSWPEICRMGGFNC